MATADLENRSWWRSSRHEGSSSCELQATADSVRKELFMIRGMAIPKDMPESFSGRVHNANISSLNWILKIKLKPDFFNSGFGMVGEDIIHREIAFLFLMLWNQLICSARRKGWKLYQDLKFLSQDNVSSPAKQCAFLDNDWTPMIETTVIKFCKSLEKGWIKHLHNS